MANYDQQIRETKEEFERWDVKGESTVILPLELE